MFAKKVSVLSVCFLGFCLLLAFSACQTTGAAVAGGGTGQPDWVRDPYAKYDKQSSVAAVGSGSSRQEAERDALKRLVSIFGQDIMVDDKVSTVFQQAEKSGVIKDWSQTTTVESAIEITTGFDALIGAEIGETWDNGKDYFAIAVLNKQKALMIYPAKIQANKDMIDNLLKMTNDEKNSIEGYTRYQFAAAVADVNISFGNLLVQIGAPLFAQGLTPGNAYRLEAQNITKAISVGINVKNDKSGRIQGAFAKVFSDQGFRSGGNNARYVLDVNITTAPVSFPNNANLFTRIEVSANLTDTKTGTVLLPYNFNAREGHTSQAEADNRAYAAAERKINGEYKDMLSNYLSQLLPKK